jgi:glutathione synthase/RimK-type ligase-like ATP-grasp enzyme
MIITTAPECYSTKRLIEEFQVHYNSSPQLLNPKRLNSNQWLNFQSNFPTLIRSTGQNYDDSDLYLAQTFNTPLIQNIEEQLIFRDKLRQYLWFEKNNFSTPPTEYNYDISSEFSTGPFIVKSRRGMRGLGVTYIENRKSLLSLLKTLHSINDQQFLVQQFIPATEYRYFIAKGKIQYVLKKEREEQITANANQDVSTELVNNFPQQSINRIISLLKSHYYAIDLLFHQGQELLLEINLAPGFKQLEQLTGDNIAKMIWNF